MFIMPRSYGLVYIVLKMCKKFRLYCFKEDRLARLMKQNIETQHETTV